METSTLLTYGAIIAPVLVFLFGVIYIAAESRDARDAQINHRGEDGSSPSIQSVDSKGKFEILSVSSIVLALLFFISGIIMKSCENEKVELENGSLKQEEILRIQHNAQEQVLRNLEDCLQGCIDFKIAKKDSL